MKLLELSLYNFCVYRGEQSFDLCPVRKNGKNRPVILIGGINGGGKTTFFDAILLALYGARANCSKKQRNQAYHDFLRECIHRGVTPNEGASVSLSFEYATKGQEHTYEVIRTWSDTDGKVRESLEVRKDGAHDGWLSKHWPQVVEEIIPLGISHLFFFDAEQIRFIAEDDTTNETLGAAIKSLLGLDLVERLIADTKVIELKLREERVSDDESKTIEERKQQLEKATLELSALRQDRSAIQNLLEKAKGEFEAAEKNFEQGGGKHWEKREKVKQEQQILIGQRQVNSAALEDLAYGLLPLTQLGDLLMNVRDVDSHEREQKHAALVGTAVEEYCERVLKRLKQFIAEPSLLAEIEEAQAAELPECRNDASIGWSVELSERTRVQIEQILGDQGSIVQQQGISLLEESKEIQSKIESIKRSLAATPQEESIKDLSNALKDKAKELGKVEQQAKGLDQKIDERKRQCEELQSQIENMLLKFGAERARTDDAHRMADLAIRTRETMREFLLRSTESKIDRLAEYIFESFRFLLRKKTFIEGINIAPDTFEITLLGQNGATIPKQRLSEGEKQIFAISVLWGLARASRRRLPAIIDTPMGRLDAAHRDNLLKRYFPNASHQTIVLSTDTEVDEKYFETLEPNVSRAYLLSFNDKGHSTQVEPGYFWKHELMEA